MNEDLSTTAKRNVEERVKKTKKILYGFLKDILWQPNKKGDHPDVDVRKSMRVSSDQECYQDSMSLN